MHSSESTIKIENYVSALLRDRTPSILRFHNLKHTAHVVQKCRELALEYSIPENDKFILETAAWFHDTGYIYGRTEHEAQSVKIAFNYLKEFNLSADFQFRLKNLILATKPVIEPATLLEEILCDADLQHLGSEDYLTWSMLLKEELELQNNVHLTDLQWNRENIAFFRKHQYYTSKARSLWDDQKQKNLALMLRMEESSRNDE
jgi:predicted metal-dependent HD superfamily phosphohydrolase